MEGEQAPTGYPGGPPRPSHNLWPNPLTPPPSSTDLHSNTQSAISAAAAASAVAASANPSHLTFNAHHTDLSETSSRMKGKTNFFHGFPIYSNGQSRKNKVEELKISAKYFVA